MKSYIAALLCLGLALAEVPSSIKEYQIKDISETQYVAGKEYKYYYDSQILNGIPQASNRRSGQRIQAEVTVQVPQENEFVVQLKHIRYGSLNQRVPAEDRVILPVDAFESHNPERELREQLEQPIKAQLKDGMIEEVHYEADEPAHVVNLKRSVLNMLSTNLKAKNVIVPPKFCPGGRCSNSAPRTASAQSQFFSAYEPTIEGNCAATYTIVRNPSVSGRSENVLNVTKAIDLADCKPSTTDSTADRPEVKYHWHLSDSCPSDQPRSKFLNASTIIRLDMAGTRDSYLIERVQSVSEYVVPDFSAEGNVISSKVNSSLILIETSSIRSQLRKPSSADRKHGKSLVYSLSWDAEREDFYRQGSEDFRQSGSPFASLEKKVEMAKQLLKQLAEELSPSKADKSIDINAPTTFLQVVRVLRMLSPEDLNKVSEIHNDAFTESLSGLNDEESQAIKDIIHTAMGAAGTQPAVEHIVEKIQRNELTEYQAAIAIRQLQNARMVSKAMVEKVKSLVSSIDVEQKPALKQASMLALGSLIRTHCVPKNDKFASSQVSRSQQNECDQARRRELVQYFIRALKEANQKWSQQVLALKSLANAALPESIPELAKIIKSSEYKEIVRSQAVIALRPLRSLVPEQVVELTMPVFMDQKIPTPVRIACAYITITSSPKPAVLKSMVQQLNKDPSPQVKSFIFTYLSNLANSTFTASPCNQKLGAEAKIALQFAKEEAKISAGSFMTQASLHSYAQKYGMDIELASTMSNSSYLPNVLGASLNGEYLGFFNRDLLSLTLASENLDHQPTYNKIMKIIFGEGQSESRARRSSSYASELRQKLVDLTKNYESMSPESSKLLAQARIMGQEVGFMPLDKSIIEYIKEKFSLSQIESLAQPLNLNLASLVSTYMYKIPTTMGLPLVIRTETPIIAQMKGSIGKRSDSEYVIRDVDMLPSIAAKTELTVEIWSPIANSGLKVREEARVQIPVRGSIKKLPAGGDNQPRYAVEIKTPSSEGRELVTIKTTPFTFTRKWERSSSEYPQPKLQIISPAEQSRVSKMNKHADIMGLRMELRSKLTGLNFERPSSSPLSPLNGPHAIHLTVKKSPTAPADQLIFKATFSANKMVQSPLQSDVHSINTQEMASSEESSEESEPFTAPQHYETKIHLSAHAKPSGPFRAISIVRKTSPDSRLQKTEAKIYKSEAQTQAEFCAETQLLFPDYPQKTSDLNRKVNARHVFAWGPSCSVNQATHKVQILEQGERTKAKREMEEKNIRDYQYCKDGQRSPVECYPFIEKASELNKYTFLIDYPNMPVWAKNYTQKAFSYFLSAHRSQADIDRYATSAASQIKAVIRMDPFNPRRENITIQEPGQRVVLKDVYLQPLREHMAFNMVSRSVVPLTVQPLSTIATCMVSDRQVLSFDQAAFQAPVTDCYNVIAKDCSPEARFAVLLKRVSMGSPAKKIKVLSKSQLIEISKDGEDFVMKVDGAEKTIPESKEAVAGNQAYARQIGKSVVRITIPAEEVTVYFDGESAAVRVPPAYFNKQCGLCGHYNRDAKDIFRGNERERHSSVLDFFKDYQIQTGSCQVSPPESHKYRKHPQPDESGSGERSSYSGRQPREVSPVQRNRITYEAGQICVSTQAVKSCPKGYYPKDTRSQTVEFGCIEDHYQGLEYEAMAQDSEITDLPEFSDRIRQSIRVANKCVRY